MLRVGSVAYEWERTSKLSGSACGALRVYGAASLSSAERADARESQPELHELEHIPGRLLAVTSARCYAVLACN